MQQTLQLLNSQLCQFNNAGIFGGACTRFPVALSYNGKSDFDITFRSACLALLTKSNSAAIARGRARKAEHTVGGELAGSGKSTPVNHQIILRGGDNEARGGGEQEKESLGVEEYGQQTSRSPSALHLAFSLASCVLLWLALSHDI
eukprot:1124338-Pelagomonas_calceolata.AAC.20